MTVYERAEDVAHIAWELIQDHHPHLENVRIEFVWRDQAAMSKGRVTLGQARKIGGLGAFLARDNKDSDFYEEFFVLEVAKDTWLGMTPKQHVALIDHELCHMVLNDKGGLTVIGHDLEEFFAVVERHGLWKRDVAEMIEVGKGIQRLQLEDGEVGDGERQLAADRERARKEAETAARLAAAQEDGEDPDDHDLSNDPEMDAVVLGNSVVDAAAKHLADAGVSVTIHRGG